MEVIPTQVLTIHINFIRNDSFNFIFPFDTTHFSNQLQQYILQNQSNVQQTNLPAANKDHYLMFLKK